MSKKRKLDKELDTQFAEDGISMDVVSATEVTGMASTPPLNEAQAEGYETLFPVRQQEADSAKKANSPKEQGKRSERP